MLSIWKRRYNNDAEDDMNVVRNFLDERAWFIADNKRTFVRLI